MEEERHVTSLATSGSVSSRFVTESDLESAKKRKEEEWRAAYARLGQEPPPPAEEEEYDPRTLYEKLSAQKEAKREEWDAKMKPSNQFRGLEPDEIQFLGEVAQEKRDEERARERAVEEELRAFKERQKSQYDGGLAPVPAAGSSGGSTSTASTQPKLSAPRTAKNNVKSLLKGVKVVTKPKAKGGGAPPPAAAAAGTNTHGNANANANANGSTSGNGIASALSATPGSDKGKAKVDEAMYRAAPVPAPPPAKAIPAPAPPEKRKIQALGADYGSDSESVDGQGSDVGRDGRDGEADAKRQKVAGL